MTITKQVQTYVMRRPSLRDCLSKGFINHSAVARVLCKDLQIKKPDAVIAALRRLAARLRSEDGRNEKLILRVLKTAAIHVQGNMAVAIIDKPKDFEAIMSFQKRVKKGRGDCTFVEGEDAGVIIVNEGYIRELKEAFKGKIIKTTEGMAQVTLVCDERLEETAGVNAYVYSLLAERGINILEERSCWTDLMFVVEQKDLPQTLELLDFAAV